MNIIVLKKGLVQHYIKLRFDEKDRQVQAMSLIRTGYSEVLIVSWPAQSIFNIKIIFLHFWVQKCFLHRMMQKSANYLE
jgi:hypothetical protein